MLHKDGEKMTKKGRTFFIMLQKMSAYTKSFD